MREFKFHHCFDCSQPFSAGQSHICVISLDGDVEYGRDRLDSGVEDGQEEPEKDMVSNQNPFIWILHVFFKGISCIFASPVYLCISIQRAGTRK